MMRRLTSAPKPSPRDCAVHVDQVVVLRRRGGRSGRRRSGPGCSTPRPWRPGSTSATAYGLCGSETSSIVAPELLVDLERRADGLLDFGIEPCAEVLARPRRSSAACTGCSSVCVYAGTGLIDAGAVAAVVAGDDFEQQGGVGDVVGERADLVERAGEGDEAEARDAAVGRLQADDAAQAGRLADGAAGVGAERQRRLARPRPPPPSRRWSRRGCAPGPTDCA